MILYDYVCATGHDFEALVASIADEAPPCPVCQAPSHRRLAKLNIGGRADAGPSRDQMPRSWQQTAGGDPETVRHWHDLAAKREKLEEKHPELAGDRRPVLAHEGIFANRPLRAGDDIAAATREAAAAGNQESQKDAHNQ